MRKLANSFDGSQAPGSSLGTGGQPNKPMPSVSGFNFGGLGAHLPKMPELPYGLTHQDILQHGLPPDASKAFQWGKDLKTQPYTSQSYWDNTGKLNEWTQQNKTHPIVQKIVQHPEAKQQLDQYNGPMGQIGRYAGPALGYMSKTPEQFAAFASMPGVKDVFANTFGAAGVPGLALAHSLASGNMSNWNTLFRPKTASARPNDVIDRYLIRMSK